MHYLIRIFVGLGVVQFGLTTMQASAAEPACAHFKTAAPVLDVLKDPGVVGNYTGALERGDVVCIKKQKKVGKRGWGLVAHKVLKDGKAEKLVGWVGMRFMAPHTPAKQGAAAITAKKKTITKPNNDKQAEIAYWNTVNGSGDAELIGSYLQQYPNGTFAGLANILLRKLRNRGKTTATAPAKNAAASAAPSEKDDEPVNKSRPVRLERKNAESKRTQRRRARKLRKQRNRKAQTATRKASVRKRTRRKKCRMESQFECIGRGGFIREGGECDRQRICK